jgi:hypothetical protein
LFSPPFPPFEAGKNEDEKT